LRLPQNIGDFGKPVHEEHPATEATSSRVWLTLLEYVRWPLVAALGAVIIGHYVRSHFRLGLSVGPLGVAPFPAHPAGECHKLIQDIPTHSAFRIRAFFELPMLSAGRFVIPWLAVNCAPIITWFISAQMLASDSVALLLDLIALDRSFLRIVHDDYPEMVAAVSASKANHLTLLIRPRRPLRLIFCPLEWGINLPFYSAIISMRASSRRISDSSSDGVP